MPMRGGRLSSSSSPPDGTNGVVQLREPRSADVGTAVGGGQKACGNDLLLVARHNVLLSPAAEVRKSGQMSAEDGAGTEQEFAGLVHVL